MIRLIAAIDSERGLSKQGMVPWNLPAYQEYLDKKTKSGTVLLTHSKARRGDLEFEVDTDTILRSKGDVWVLGSSELYNRTISNADELYIMQINGLHECDEFFPGFERDFELFGKSRIKRENGIEYQFQMWRKK